jgi:hypothetical protein
LGLKRLKVWNQTSMLRHIWSIFARSGSLWMAWIKENFLKQNSFWSVGIPQNCSWCWRKILKLSNITKKFLRFEVGDGKTIHLWLDCWHPAGILLDIYGYRAVYDAHSSVEAKLSFVIHNGTGFGGLLDLKLWWKYKPKFLKFDWVLWTNLSGMPRRRVIMLALIHERF